MREWLDVILLGIIEGVTEFLPVSSTGHLLLAEKILPQQSDVFNIVIQSAAVLSVILVFKDRVKQMVLQWRDPAVRDYILKLLLAFVITGVGGVLLKKAGLKLPKDAAPVAWATLVGGVLFLALEMWLKKRPKTDAISWVVVAANALAQLVAAVFPGTSRSGACILFSLALGVSRPAAAEFSFLLGVPTLLSAGALELASEFLKKDGAHEPLGLLLLGCVVAGVTAFISVKWLMRFIQTHTFTGFGWYRIALGILILVMLR